MCDTLQFAAGGNVLLDLATPTSSSSALAEFATGDVIGLAGIQAESLKYADNTLTLPQ